MGPKNIENKNPFEGSRKRVSKRKLLEKKDRISSAIEQSKVSANDLLAPIGHAIELPPVDDQNIYNLADTVNTYGEEVLAGIERTLERSTTDDPLQSGAIRTKFMDVITGKKPGLKDLIPFSSSRRNRKKVEQAAVLFHDAFFQDKILPIILPLHNFATVLEKMIATEEASRQKSFTVEGQIIDARAAAIKLKRESSEEAKQLRSEYERVSRDLHAQILAEGTTNTKSDEASQNLFEKAHKLSQEESNRRVQEAKAENMLRRTTVGFVSVFTSTADITTALVSTIRLHGVTEEIFDFVMLYYQHAYGSALLEASNQVSQRYRLIMKNVTERLELLDKMVQEDRAKLNPDDYKIIDVTPTD